jgi:hypothetical protein
MNVLSPALLASEVLDQNRRFIHRKRRSQAIGFPAPVRQRLAMGNTTEIDAIDHGNDESYGQLKSHPRRSAPIAPHDKQSKSQKLSVKLMTTFK